MYLKYNKQKPQRKNIAEFNKQSTKHRYIGIE